MQQRQTIITISATQTQKLGQRLAQKFCGGEVIALVGDLGTGKTVISRGIARGLGVKHRIISPTFVLMRIYRVRGHKKIRQLVHVDAYRIRHAEELIDIGLGDYLGQPDTVTIIEWADRAKKILPHEHITITLKLKKRQSSRHITVHQP